MAFSSYQDVVTFLVQKYGGDGIASASALATYQKVFGELQTKPVVLSGLPGTGKTTTAKALVRQWPSSALILDVHNEYSEPSLRLTRIQAGKLLSIDFSNGKRVRFVPDPNFNFAGLQCSEIFRELLAIMHSQKLQNTTVVIEESHRFAKSASLRALISESRKFIAKMVIVCSDPTVYSNSAVVLYPPPLKL